MDQGNCYTRVSVSVMNVPRSTQSTHLGYKSPFIKPFLNKTNQKVYKRKRYRKRVTCFMSPKKEKKNNKGDNANMLNNKRFFSSFFNTKYKQRVHILKTRLRGRQQSWKPSNQSKAGVCFFVYANTYRLGYVNEVSHQTTTQFYQCMLHL